VLDFELPDTAGITRKDEPIDENGPDGRLSTLPSGEIVAAWNEGGVPGYVSDSAGTYLCNQWLYETLALTAAAPNAIPAGFVHVPALPAQAVANGRGSDAVDDARAHANAVIETAIEIIARRLDAAAPAPPPRAAGESWIPGRTQR